jgi:hypothetical protein
MKSLFLLLSLLIFSNAGPQWGFFAHRKINRLAVFTLPPEMLGFYKYNIDYLTEEAIAPDKRRYVVKEEAARHYIDLDEYDTIPPIYWTDAVAKYSEDSLQKYGILPWHIALLSRQLTEAFKAGQKDRILRISADIGHYIADAHVPLHTTKNYNGQLTGQEGIHGFWESRLPELFSEEYDLLTGRAVYLPEIQQSIWEIILSSNKAVDSVLNFEKQLTLSFPDDRKFSFETRGTTTVKLYSREFSEEYHILLNRQVERQMKNSIRLTGNIWYTCWVNAGKPALEMERIDKKSSEHHENAAIISDDCHGKH